MADPAIPANSILYSIKHKLGPEIVEQFFETDIITYVNMSLSRLNQLGVGTEGFLITGMNETWDQFEPLYSKIPEIDTFAYLKCKQLFDPSANATISATIEKQIAELTWLIEVNIRQLKEDLDESD